MKCNHAYDEENDTFTCMRGHRLYHVHDTSKGQVYDKVGMQELQAEEAVHAFHS